MLYIVYLQQPTIWVDFVYTCETALSPLEHSPSVLRHSMSMLGMPCRPPTHRGVPLTQMRRNPRHAVFSWRHAPLLLRRNIFPCRHTLSRARPGENSNSNFQDSAGRQPAYNSCFRSPITKGIAGLVGKPITAGKLFRLQTSLAEALLRDVVLIDSPLPARSCEKK